jgi:DME family drug/metabolite transporter
MPSTAAPLGVVALILASLLWGTTGTSAHLLPADVSPLAVGASTMTVGGALLLVATMRGAVAVLRDAVGRRWVALGALGVFVYPLAFYSGMDLAGVAVGNVVALGSGPVFAAILERVIEHRRLSRRWAIATGLALVGIALLALGRDEGAGADAAGAAVGIGLALLAGAAYALYTYASSRAIRDTGRGSSGVMGAMFGLGALLLLPVLLVTGAPLLQSPSSIGIAAYLAIGPMFAAYLLFGVGLRTVTSTAATTITLLEPVVATVLAVLIVGERLGAVGWVGLALILVGLTVLITARRAPAATARL